jgi:hypothetical protein
MLTIIAMHAASRKKIRAPPAPTSPPAKKKAKAKSASPYKQTKRHRAAAPAAPTTETAGEASPPKKVSRGSYRKYDPRAVDLAVADHMDKHPQALGARAASKLYSVPWATFRRALQHAQAAGVSSADLQAKWAGVAAGTKPAAACKGTVLDQEEEGAIEDFC